MRKVIALCLALSPAPAAAQGLSMIECAAYGPVLIAGGESVKGLAKVARDIDLSSIKTKVDEETRRAIARLEDANVNLQPVMQEWSAAASDLAAKLKTACGR
ncbi:hypothetical protein [Enterovirga sp.]|jgi:hypothetical protein|uniref:hypothetical protein n=1 Tax=Enterovirga sp. TaxID=2026350 RepID=UPI0026274CD8|nr:hypothetical protein [Enterovirga sp.]MDB5589824.1 hypothetical protein [Enterovirga sp.]